MFHSSLITYLFVAEVSICILFKTFKSAIFFGGSDPFLDKLYSLDNFTPKGTYFFRDILFQTIVYTSCKVGSAAKHGKSSS
jgi:hypothetical protein